MGLMQLNGEPFIEIETLHIVLANCGVNNVIYLARTLYENCFISWIKMSMSHTGI